MTWPECKSRMQLVATRANLTWHSTELIELCAAHGLYFLNCFPTRKEWIRVAINKHFDLQIMNILSSDTVGPFFSCNLTVFRVAINIHSELQILSASVWYYTTPSVANPTVVRVAIDIHSELQILSAFAWYYTTPSIATKQWSELQSMHNPSCKYWVLPYPFSCNWIVVRVAIDIHYELQILSFFTSCNHCIIGSCNQCIFRVVIGKLSVLQLAF
jgi:hypothetical protein